MAAATITTTSTFPVPAGLPSPRSPTLSDAGMILPETDTLRSISPSPYIERPPSPPTLYTHSSRSAETIKLGSAPRSRRGPSPLVKSPPLSAKSSRSTLRNMPDSHTAAIVNRSAVRGGGGGGDALASSPTMQDNALGIYTPPESNGKYPRNGSNGSGSVQSDDLDNWPTFDSHPHLDDSGVVLEDEDEDGDEDEEKRDHFPSDDASVDEEMDNERWLNDKSDEDDDLYSSAALSRRAEMILANAKKRLNVMEGNLRGARESLVISPTFNTTRSASALSQQFITTRERDRRLYAGIGPIPPRTYPYRSTTLASSNSPGHSRGLSETSVPLPFSPSYLAKTAPNKRASSALGVGSGPWSPDTHGHGRFPIRETRSFETMRDPRGTAWAQEDRDASLNSHSRGSRSPTTLETLPEDESPKLHRSSSTTSDLRGQMNDLKGRISSLKMRAKEDSLRRRSLQSLRTPSPFTAAEVWYTGSDAYKASGSPVAADAGVGYKSLPKAKRLNSDGSSNSSTPKVTPASEIPAGNLQTVKEVNQNGDQAMARDHKQYPVRHYDAAREQPLDQLGEEDKEEEEDTDDGDFVSVDGDDPDQAGESVYEDAVYEMPATERHEDRLDAFDYENFFLHSAMGTYSTDSRRSSISSGESVATTRPTTAVHIRTGSTNSARRVSYHQRNSSVDSVSTVATFATAAEEQESSDEENEQMDQFSQQLLPNQSSVTPRHITQNGLTSPRSDSAIHMRQAHSSPTQTTPRGTSPDLVTGLQTSKIYSILLETPSREEPRLALNEEEKQLIYSLAATFQQVCASLQSTSGEQYARQELRRRLDQARRVLNGEDFDNQTF